MLKHHGEGVALLGQVHISHGLSVSKSQRGDLLVVKSDGNLGKLYQSLAAYGETDVCCLAAPHACRGIEAVGCEQREVLATLKLYLRDVLLRRECELAA